jgi:DNA invertase Pin-like site-specific DNA recombinase
MDGYIRVSRVSGREGDSFISPDEQRRKIESWAQLRDVEIVAWHEDFDQSGNKRSRPGLDLTLERIEAGETDGIAVAKLDRLSRLGTADALKLVEHIVTVGGSFAAIDLGIDPTTPSGEMMLTLMLALAHMQWRELSEGWESAKGRAVARGVKIGVAPLGYVKGQDGTLTPSDDAANIKEAFRLAGGHGVARATAFLGSKYPDRVWTPSTTRRLLSSRTYLGQVVYGELMNDSAHEPLVTRPEWEAAQHPGRERRVSEHYQLSGLVTCAGCDRPLVGATAGGRAAKGSIPSVPGARVYRCKYTNPKCDAPCVISAERLERYVRKALKRVWLEGGAVVGDTPPEGSEGAQQALEEAEAELYAFAADTTMRKALGPKYGELLATRTQAVEEARQEMRKYAQETARMTRVLPQDALDTDDPELLRDLLHAAFSKIEVTRGRGTVSKRTRLILHGSDVPMTPLEIS